MCSTEFLTSDICVIWSRSWKSFFIVFRHQHHCHWHQQRMTFLLEGGFQRPPYWFHLISSCLKMSITINIMTCHKSHTHHHHYHSLCAKRGGVRKMLQSAKTFTYIWSIGWSYDMFNLVGHHFPYFMAILLPFYGFFWPKMAIFGHRQSQQPQIGWTLGEQGWTLFFTSGGISLGLLDHTEMSLGGPRTAQNGLFLAKNGNIWP